MACAAAGGWGAGVGWAAWYGLFAPPRPPPPVILPGAAFASLCLAGAFAPGFALRARAAAGGLGRFSGTCLDGSVRRYAVRNISEWRGAAERDVGVRRRVSDNRQDSNHPRLARAPRGGLRGLRPQVPPATFASRPVRRTPASRSAAPRYARYTLSDRNCAIKSATEYTLRKSPSAKSWTCGRVLVQAIPVSAPLS